jgi:hypothetical protein
MLLRDPYFQLYLLHVAALFVIALWPRISNSQARAEQPQPLISSAVPPLSLEPPYPGLIRHWSLGRGGREGLRFHELESAWRQECSTKFSQVLRRITLV